VSPVSVHASPCLTRRKGATADSRVGAPASANRRNGRSHPAERSTITGSWRSMMTCEIRSPLHRAALGAGSGGTGVGVVVVSCAGNEPATEPVRAPSARTEMA